MRDITKRGLEIIKEFESLQLKAYLDPVGIWTIGYGHALRNKVGNFLRGERDREEVGKIFPNGITEEEAERMLMNDVQNACTTVEFQVTSPLTNNQFSALVSFVFNVGGTAFRRSTMLKYLNKRKYALAAQEFKRWNKSNGKILAGLTRRRKAEEELFLS